MESAETGSANPWEFSRVSAIENKKIVSKFRCKPHNAVLAGVTSRAYVGEYLLEQTQRCHQNNWVTGSWTVCIIQNHCFSTLLPTPGAKHVCLHKGGSGRVTSITWQCCCCSLLTIKAICFETSKLSLQAVRMGETVLAIAYLSTLSYLTM